MNVARGTFQVTLVPGSSELGGAVHRFEITKTFHGDLSGTSTGVMLSAGDPQSGEAGYVAVEVVNAALTGRAGRFAMQQFGTMHDGTQNLYYEIVPGSGSGELVTITGRLLLTIDAEGTHHYEIEYSV